MGRLKLEGLVNTRDLGGIAAGGRSVKKGRLLRSGQLFDGTPGDISTLVREHGMARVVDFRTDMERDEKPDPDGSYKYYSLPIFTEATFGITHEESGSSMFASLVRASRGMTPAEYMVEMYRSMAVSEFSQAQYGRFFDILSSASSGATLWHCSAGKDRAGIAAALVLAALGADAADIYGDYIITAEYTRDVIEAVKTARLFPPEAVPFIDAFFGVDESYIDGYFSEAKKLCGSVDAYLAERLGVDDNKRACLAQLYLE